MHVRNNAVQGLESGYILYVLPSEVVIIVPSWSAIADPTGSKVPKFLCPNIAPAADPATVAYNVIQAKP